MMSVAQLTFEGKTIELPVIIGTENEKAIDISTLRDATGLVTMDLGYKNTGATKSAVTFLDGELGILRYRGYPIEQLAEKSNFIEVAYLLIYGELPTKAQFDEFTEQIKMHTLVNEDIKKILDGFPASAHPMGVLSSLVCSLTAFYPESVENPTPDNINLNIFRLLAKMPTFVGWAYKKSMGHPVNYPMNRYDYCQNFLHMMFALPVEDFHPDPIVVDALNKLLILHADHEQNCSASTVRMVGSSKASLYSSISAGINALWGPLHGGANQEVIEMLDEIRLMGIDPKDYLEKVKRKEVRLMGFGHRVYKNFDPRAKIIKKACDQILSQLGVKDPILDIAKGLEEAALTDEYFISRKLYPNVDFYSGIIYRALGIPTNMFTVMFALGRLPGWIAQWKELNASKEPIGRPRQIYTGATSRDFVSISER
ncbi:MAG TPA: citrate synthase [Catalimonadaceae bacterium]|nr:citrate synthase [Catalimonadaceae bacterium]